MKELESERLMKNTSNIIHNTSMQVKLSIVVPIYNVEQYIAPCLDSLYQQDIPESEYEVICVNDASPDGSREIVKEYQTKHKNLILVEHEKNMKLGAARNTGRRIAQGEYIWNVDSDDLIVPNCLKKMLEICDRDELDVLMFGVRRLWNGKLYDRDVKLWDESASVSTGLNFWKAQGEKNKRYISPVWTQVFRKEFMDAEHIYSPEINMGEDVPYTFSAILLSNRMKAINMPCYIYRDNTESLTGVLRKHPNQKAVYENSFVCSAYMYWLQQKMQQRHKDILKSINSITKHIIVLYTYYVHMLSKEEKQVFLSLCRKNYFKNLFVYKVLNKRQGLEYTKFIITGKEPQYK